MLAAPLYAQVTWLEGLASAVGEGQVSFRPQSFERNVFLGVSIAIVLEVGQLMRGSEYTNSSVSQAVDQEAL